MKKFLAATLGLVCAMVITVHADDTATGTNAPSANPPQHHHLTPEQKALMQEMLAKYDTNHDGKLDKEEKAGMSAEDKEKCEKAGIIFHHHKKPAADAGSSSTDTNTPAK